MNIGNHNTLDFSKLSSNDIPRWTTVIKKNDTKRTMPLTLVNAGVAIDLNIHTVEIFAIKPDGKLVFNDVSIVNATNGEISVEISNQLTVVPGNVLCEIVIYNAQGVVASSSKFAIKVIDSLKDDSALESTNEFTALTNALNKVDTWDGQFEEKYNNLEATYAEDLTGVKSQLADTMIDISSRYVDNSHIRTQSTVKRPEVDLLDTTKTTVLSTPVGKYNAFTSMVFTSDGKILISFREATSHLSYDGVIKQIESNDMGVTWSNERIILQENGIDLRDPCYLKLSNGNILLKYFDRSENLREGRLNYIKYALSTDNGNTWTKISTNPLLSNMGQYDNVATRGNFIQLSNGDILSANYGTNESKGVFVSRSKDNGVTWNNENWIIKGAYEKYSSMNETSLCYFSETNEIVALMRSEVKEEYGNDNGQISDITISKSTDNGVTWSKPISLGTTGHAPITIKLFENTMLTMFRQTDKTQGKYDISNKRWQFELNLATVDVKNMCFSSPKLNLKRTGFSWDFGYGDGFVENNIVYLCWYDANSNAIYFKTIPLSFFYNLDIDRHTHKEFLTLQNDISTRIKKSELLFDTKYLNTSGTLVSRSNTTILTGYGVVPPLSTAQTNTVNIAIPEGYNILTCVPNCKSEDVTETVKFIKVDSGNMVFKGYRGAGNMYSNIPFDFIAIAFKN